MSDEPSGEASGEVQVELERMLEADRAIRKTLWEAMQGHGHGSPEFEKAQADMVEVDGRNVVRLIEILEEHGWPTLSTVGESASDGAFLVLQHAGLEVQKRFLPMLRAATEAGESSSKSLPLLEDRIRMREGRKQLYGSQVVRGEDGQFKLWPIEDEAHVDERRASAGMSSLDEYLQRAGLGHLRGDESEA